MYAWTRLPRSEASKAATLIQRVTACPQAYYFLNIPNRHLRKLPNSLTMRVVRRRKPWWILIVAIPIYCIWWPINAGLEKRRKIKREISKRRTREATIPKPLPRKRPRVLSSAQNSEGWSTLIGRRGTLLGRLPYEIRQMIYTYVLSYGMLRLTHLPDQRRIQCFRYDYKREDNPSSQFTISNSRKFCTSNKLSLLKTCRFIYMESVQTLYSTNTFGFFDFQLSTYSYFSRTILPERLASITSIHLTVYPGSFDWDEWTQLWNNIVNQLAGLRDVKVWMLENACVLSLEMSLDAEWVKPMLALKGLKTFYLGIQAGFLSSSSSDSGYTFYPSNFDIDRRQSPEEADRREKLLNVLRERICA